MLNKIKRKNKSYTPRHETKEWKDLLLHKNKIARTKISDLFQETPRRANEFSAAHDGILIDYSKQLMSAQTLKLLFKLLEKTNFKELQESCFKGDPINLSENRAVLHTALRAPKDKSFMVDGFDIMPDIHQTLSRMKTFCEENQKSKKYKRIINIGIGGSDLGPNCVCMALRQYALPDCTVEFVSNVDATQLTEALRGANPEEVLIIITSKTFTTQETMTNAQSGKLWLEQNLKNKNINDHFVAITANAEEAIKFGIPEERIFPLWDWVGGRFSLWSAVGLSIALYIGFENFRALLDGAHSMDKHFREAHPQENLPVLLALTGVWNRNFMDCDTLALIPYDQYLQRFPAYVQQIDMESNGKHVTREGHKISGYKTGPVIFGAPGTNAQHAFFQLIHQGSFVIPTEFILFAETLNPLGDHFEKLISNALGQTKALMDGREHECPHRKFEGNRPSVTLLLNRLDPYHLGLLLALYEHKIFVQGIIWDINSFDQWGVELGKEISGTILSCLHANLESACNRLDSSTRLLLSKIKKS